MSDNDVANNQPSHRLYMVIGEGDDAVWKAIGAAWPNRDGRGFSIEFDGRLVLREPRESSKPSPRLIPA